MGRYISMNLARDDGAPPSDGVAAWARSLLVCPCCKMPLSCNSNQLICSACGPIGKVEDGILRFAVTEDASIAWYRSRGGSHFFERSHVPYAMSTLDTPVYHQYLASLRSSDTKVAIVDVGAGDGRNTIPWLDWGFERVIAMDAVFSSLRRLRERLTADHPEWLERILLVEGDMRRLPLAANSVETVFAIESLYYLNEDYDLGLAECRRILKQTGRMLIAERSWEGAVLTRLLYSGVEAMLALSESREMWDGSGADAVRSRCFTEEELVAILEKHGLIAVERKGVHLAPLLLGYLRGEGKLTRDDQKLLPQVRLVLQRLGEHGHMRRTHVVVAKKAGQS
jgi:ubiquinone/menaquinone biosynthesis C-methylase UbiE